MGISAAAGSWQVTRGGWRTLTLAGALCVLALGLGEALARTSAVRDALQAPSVGSPSRDFEQQLHNLARYAARTPIDCLVLGNSTVLMGVDPNALGEGYAAHCGKQLHCFAFGVPGMTASAAGAVAPILVKKFQPRLLIYLASVRDLGASVDGPLIANTAWVQQHNGRASVAGALTEHSALARYYLLYRQWLDPMLWRVASAAFPSTAQGYLPFDPHWQMSAGEIFEHMQRTYAAMLRQPLSRAEVDGFAAVLQTNSDSTRVLVVEAPMPLPVSRWTRHFSSFYDDAIRHMRSATRQRRVPFWRIASWKVVGADGWADPVHLNPRGARLFSAWLGARLAGAQHSGHFALSKQDSAA